MNKLTTLNCTDAEDRENEYNDSTGGHVSLPEKTVKIDSYYVAISVYLFYVTGICFYESNGEMQNTFKCNKVLRRCSTSGWGGVCVCVHYPTQQKYFWGKFLHKNRSMQFLQAKKKLMLMFLSCLCNIIVHLENDD